MKIALLLSGGVDSAVALYELVRRGEQPDCFYIKIGPTEDAGDWDCTSEEDILFAQQIAKQYNCRFEVVDCHKEYWDEVARYTIEKVRVGLTPNPDVMCNRLIKFGAFNTKVGYVYDYLATGHYANTEVDEQGDTWLTTCPDLVKDQTDFLAQLLPCQLQRSLFPIGHYTKDQVRTIAHEQHLANASRKDSQGICFLGKINYNEYIKRYLGEQVGEVIELETGKVIGEHKGLWFHTIGQRKGLGFGGGPWFVVKKDIPNNVLYVSKGYAPPAVYTDTFPIQDLHFLTHPIPLDAVQIKIRHQPEFYEATISGQGVVHTKQSLNGVAPGQFVVIYDSNHHRCFGSAEIMS